MPNLKALIGASVSNLAAIALALWPDWYGDAVRLPSRDLSAFEFERLLAEQGVAEEEALAVFNLGIGLCAVVADPPEGALVIGALE